MNSIRLRLSSVAVIASAASLVLIASASARTAGDPLAVASAPEMKSHLGSYLAGRVARGLNDTQYAVSFYRRAAGRSPDNIRIIERVFLMEATEGNWEEATAAARRLIKSQPTNRLGRLWLGVAAFRKGDLKAADRHFDRASTGPIGELTSTLARAWTAAARADGQNAAFRILNPNGQQSWSQHYLRYHRALIADILGQRKRALRAYGQIFDADPRTPRTTAAYIHHAIRAGKFRLAGRIARSHIDASSNGGHASIQALFDKIKAGEPTDLLVKTPQEGLAEVFYGLGEALTGEGGLNLGTVYLQMALSLKPDFPFALAALANVYEATQRFDRAILTYERIRTGTPLDVSITIRKAINYNSLDQPDQSKEMLDRLIAERPEDVQPLEALGNILRGRKRYKEAISYYTRLLELLPDDRQQYWTYWYARGTSYERIKDWPSAEKDLLKAMELDPDQALILNYLGYSWVDQKMHLERALELIKRAVALKPDDGYIVDSLGWAYYRLGRFDEAVAYLERAVELRPEDPILNDHLGDALWQVGRKREARFQWEQALTLEPEKADAINIRKKLLSGLPRPTGVKAVKERGKKVKDASKIGKRADVRPPRGDVVPVR